MLTAADVEQKTFSTALRGYDLDEVDDFLDEIVATIRDLTEKLEAAEAAAARPSAADEGPASAPTDQPVRALDESAVGRALIAAQSAADRLMEEAEQQAASIVEEAKIQADTWEDAREAKRTEAEAEIARIAARVSTVRSELAALADEVAVKLDDMDAVIEGRHAAGDREARGKDDHEGAEPGDDTSDGMGAGEDVAHPLDEMLNGVVTDLQMEDEDEEDEPSRGSEADESDTEESDAEEAETDDN